jgi:ubiquinone/menaquinone biosynthesis C-methylase UbiE
MGKVDYEAAAAVYDRRYREGGPSDLVAFVRARCAETAPRAILEVGCGTGRWLLEAAASSPRVVGIDPSAAMLAHARERVAEAAHLVRGRAEQLPLPPGLFGLVLCIFAQHHFDDPPQSVAEAARVLAPGGLLSVVALAPHHGQDRWYVYDCFPGTREADLARYPTTTAISGWMTAAGLDDVHIEVAARIARVWRGAGVFEDPILDRYGTCQLALLSDEEFAQGMDRIRAEVARRPDRSFETDLTIFAISGLRAPARTS